MPECTEQFFLIMEVCRKEDRLDLTLFKLSKHWNWRAWGRNDKVASWEPAGI